MNLKDCVPTNKYDVDAISRAKALGFPELNDVFPQLLEWVKDINWPVARPLLDLFSHAGPENAPYILAALESDDDIRKYYIICNLMPRFGQALQGKLLEAVKRIACEPSGSERREGVDAAAQQFLAEAAQSSIA